MNRRQFLGTALDATAIAAVAAALQPLAAVAANAAAEPVFFDPRFPAARALAEQLAGGSELLPVSGDPLDLLERHVTAGNAISSSTASGSRFLRGVTPESVPFCLSQISHGGQRPTLTLTRIDQDLFSWQLEFPA